MKTWIWLLVALVGGYLVYTTWFAPDEEEADSAAESPLVLEVPPQQPSEVAEPSPDSEWTEPRRIELEAGPGEVADAATRAQRDEAAWELDHRLRAARKSGDEQSAAELERRLLADHPDSDPARWLQFERGARHWQAYSELGRSTEGLQEARRAWALLTPALFLRGAEAAEKERLREKLAKLAQDLLFGSRHVEGVDFSYTPKSGDNLSTLCRKVFPAQGARLSPGFVASVNGMGSPRELRAGEPIRVPLGQLSLVVSKQEFLLYVLLDDCYVRHFPVGLGREGATPEASFVIDNKLRNPDWFPRPGVKIPYGHPENILGTRWLGFRNSSELRGFGIHGTSDPSSIGREESSGCVRMLRADVELLFEWVPEGTPVEIRR